MLNNWDRAFFSSLWATIFQGCLLENYIQVFLSIKYFVRNLTLQTKRHPLGQNIKKSNKSSGFPFYHSKVYY